MPSNVFICHATEDKDAVARPLAQQLITAGYKVWYDEYSLSVGDSLLKSIGDGLSRCDYGIVIFSKVSINKFWPAEEISGLFERECEERRKIILPIRHGLSSPELKRFNPILAGRLSVSTDIGLQGVVNALNDAILRDGRRTFFEEYAGKSGGRLVFGARSNSGSDFDLGKLGEQDFAEIKRLIGKLEAAGKLIRK